MRRQIQAPQPGERQVLAVSELNRQAKRLLEGQFGQVWVQGEVSNLATPRSGHWYFTLKDNQAQIRCAMFRNRNSLLRFKPAEGDQLVVRGRVSLYEGRGDYQLIAENMQPAGAGALQLRLEELKTRLQTEGLFDDGRKQPLPAYPNHVAIISSPSGAALQDILSVFQRRAPHILLSLLPVTVQGAVAAAELTNAVTLLQTQHSTLATPLDAIIIARGGGSLEDLWGFNDENLARAIASCAVPVVSAVGHETDFTVCDLVADVRAPTPSAAAELLSPDGINMLASLQQLQGRLARLMAQKLQRQRSDLQQLRRMLRNPGQRLDELNQRCDDLTERLRRAMQQRLVNQRHALLQARSRLQGQNPRGALALAASRLEHTGSRLQPAIVARLEQSTAKLQHQARMLNTVSPLATLERGYAIVETEAEGSASPDIVRDSTTVSPGTRIRARLKKGEILATVTETVSS